MSLHLYMIHHHQKLLLVQVLRKRIIVYSRESYLCVSADAPGSSCYSCLAIASDSHSSPPVTCYSCPACAYPLLNLTLPHLLLFPTPPLRAAQAPRLLPPQSMFRRWHVVVEAARRIATELPLVAKACRSTPHTCMPRV